MSLATRVPLAVLVSGLLPGCGGGGGDGGQKGPVTVTLRGVPELDGVVFANGQLFLGSIEAGDRTIGSEQPARGFVSFDLTPVPEDATIQSAVLTLIQFNVTGDPFAFSSVRVDHVSYGTVFEPGAYSRSPLEADIGVLSTSPVLGPRSITVTAQVQNDVDRPRRDQSQYRLRFTLETDGDGATDHVLYYDAGAAPSPDLRPALVVTYLP